MLYPDSGISMDEEIVLGDMIWSYNKAELISFCSFYSHSTQYSSMYRCNTKDSIRTASTVKLML